MYFYNYSPIGYETGYSVIRVLSNHSYQIEIGVDQLERANI